MISKNFTTSGAYKGDFSEFFFFLGSLQICIILLDQNNLTAFHPLQPLPHPVGPENLQRINAAMLPKAKMYPVRVRGAETLAPLDFPVQGKTPPPWRGQPRRPQIGWR